MPTFRSSRSGRQFGDGANRTRTGQVDHDVFEGLPVRRWTRQTQTISQVPKTEAAETILPGPGGKQTIPEHPMPRDSHLLTPASRALLRASRAGCIYIRQTATKEEDNEEKDATDVEEQPVLQSSERSFVTRKWTTVPKHLEPAEVEFLAKRRPGLPSLYGAAAAGVDGADGANVSQPMRRTRFKKVDPTSGNISVYEAWVPEGHKIEGEIANDTQLAPENTEAPVTVTPEAPAPGTVIEGVGVVNGEGVVVAEAGSAAVMTPPKRRPPPPKRKAKGFGKGRRKKVMFAPGEGGDASLVHGAGTGADGTQEKDGDASSRVSADQPGQEDEDDDGEDGEESDEGDESMLEAKTPETPMQQAGAEPVSESAAEQTPASTTATDTVADTNLSETPQLPSQVPEASTTPSDPEEPTRPAGDGAVAALTEQNTAEDVEMTDSKPDAPVGETDITIPPPAPATAEAANEPTQETPQPESSTLPTESKDQPMGEDTKEPTATDPSTSAAPVAPQDDAMDISADQPQVSSEKAETEPPAQTDVPSGETQEQPKPEESTDIDMLDSLEASLDKPVDSEQPPQPDQTATTEPVTEQSTSAPAEPTPVEAEKSPEQPIPATETLEENTTTEQPAAPTDPVPASTEETPTPAEPANEAPIPEKSPEEPEQPSTQQEPASAPEHESEPQKTEEQEQDPVAEPSQPTLDQPAEQEQQAQPNIPAAEESAPSANESPAPQPAAQEDQDRDQKPQEPTPTQPADAPSSTETDTPAAATAAPSGNSIPELETNEEAGSEPEPEPAASESEPKPESEPELDTKTTDNNDIIEGKGTGAE